MKGYLLGIDVGTTIIKCVVFDIQGNEVAKASHSASIIHPKPGWAEQDMSDVWNATVLSIKEAIKKANLKSEEIIGISVSGQGAGTWLINEEGKPVCNAINWLDGRAANIIDRWDENGTIEKLNEICGLRYYSGSGPGIIFRWLIENNPKVLKESKAVIWAKDWVRYCLTGEIYTDETDPSMGLLDLKTRRYSNDVLKLTEIEEYSYLLPPIKSSYEMGGKITKIASEETGLKEGTPVAIGAWDCSSTALGLGCVLKNEAFSIIGTAGIHMVVTDKPVIDRSYSLSCHTVPGKYLIHSMSMTAANNLNWFEREFCLAERIEAERKNVSKYDIINEIVSEIPIGSNGIIFLPFLQGERAPFVEPRARGDFFGLGDWTKRGDLLRAVYEGVAFSTLHNYEAMEKGVSFERVRLGGGGSQSSVWAQIISDCTGRVMEVTSGSEYGARGAAINAAIMLGIYKNHKEAVNEMVKVERVYEPNPKNTEMYRDLYHIYTNLIESLMKMWVDMNKLMEEKLISNYK